jgi:hypothetical protein
MQVKSNGKIEQVGYFLPYAGESSSTYWASDEIVYVADYSRGLDILRWTGPTYAPAAPGGGGGGGGGSGGDGGGGGGGGTQLPGPGVRLRISDRNPDQGDQVGFRVALRRCKGNKGTTVKLQRKVKGDYKPLATKALGSNCVAKFTDVASYKRASYRATWPKQNDDYRAGKSRPQTVTPQP